MLIKKAIVFYVFWISTHYVSTHLYTHYCTPWSLLGFIMSPFTTSSPQCKALQWFVSNGSSSIHTMWILIGTHAIRYFNSGSPRD